MPLVRFSTSVAGPDFAYGDGDEVELPPDKAQQAVAAGWGELVRGRAPETPESRGRAAETPEGARPTRRTAQRS